MSNNGHDLKNTLIDNPAVVFAAIKTPEGNLELIVNGSTPKDIQEMTCSYYLIAKNIDTQIGKIFAAMAQSKIVTAPASIIDRLKG